MTASAIASKPAKRVSTRSTKAVTGSEIKAEAKGVRKLRRDIAKYGFYGVVVGEIVLTGLSLSHLALGISLVTRASQSATFSDYVFASTFDVMMLVVKTLLIAIPKNKEKNNEELHFYGNIFVIGALVVSAALNALAFANEAKGMMVYPSILFGLIVPASLYLLTKVAAKTLMFNSRA